MTLREHLTLQGMQKQLEDYIREDSIWKSDFDKWKTNLVEPLIKAEADTKAVKAWLYKIFKWLLGAISFAISIGAILHYFGYLIGVTFK